MEERLLLSTFTVTKNTDDGSSGTLRWAINQVLGDASPASGGDTIAFGIGTTGSTQTIVLGSALPQITKPVIIDGWSQGGVGYDGSPLIEISGGSLAATDSVLTISGGSSTIDGLVIDGSKGFGIKLSTKDGNTVIGSYIGTDTTGKAAKANLSGIYISGSSSNTIGGTTPADRNIISGNTNQGIIIGDAGVANDNLVIGNYIGVDVTGQAALANRQNGIIIDHTVGTTVGGTVAGAGNVVSGNGQEGIIVDAADGNSDSNVIAGNKIGVAADGVTQVRNVTDGVTSYGISSIFVSSPGPTGSTDPSSSTTHTRVGPGNIISGNGRYGVFLDRGVGNTSLSSDWIEGNTITNNGDVGVNLFASSGNTIGGTNAAERNVVSGNGGTGINIDSSFVAVQNLIEGNFVGTDSSGTKAYPNYGDGVSLWNTQNTLGGTAAGAGNLISGNAFNGVVVNGDHMVIQGNLIGTDWTGTGSIPNADDGIHLSSSNNLIGGTAAGAGNVIANNARGVSVGSTFDHDGILSNSIYGNFGLGIDLGSTVEPTPNAPGTIAGNDNPFYPILASAVTDGLTTTVTGSLTSAANTSYIIQFFASPSADPSGFGEGQVYLGQTIVTTDVNGLANFIAPNLSAIVGGEVVSATATDPSNNTSEFSRNIVGVAHGDVGLTMQASPDPVLVGGTLTYTIKVTNDGLLTMHGVTVTDQLPSSLIYSSGSTDVGTVSRDGQSVTASLGTLTVGQVATVIIQAVVGASALESIRIPRPCPSA